MDKNEGIKPHQPAKYSFTLIESLVIVAIIIIFTGFSLAYYNNFTEEKKLETEVKKLVDVLELAKKKASAGDLYTPCSDFRGYQVTVISSSYSLQFCCGDSCGTAIQTYNFPTNIISTTSKTVIFNPLSAKTTENSTITVKNTSLSKCVDLTIAASGLITEGAKYSCP